MNIDGKLIQKASKLTGIGEKTALVRLGLQSLIALESGKRFAKVGGTEKKLTQIPRRGKSAGNEQSFFLKPLAISYNPI
ncbi:MAG: type II toxin-antitoxin system VapB family antitoxin [Desulfomonilaceae bacterium]